MKKITIIGFFAHNSNYNGGQENKTRAVYKILKEKYGESTIETIDTLNWKKHPIKLLISIIKSVMNSEAIIMMPAQNGVKFFLKIYTILNKIYRRKLLYVVIGGWLPDFFETNKKMLKYAKQIDKILVETNKMKQKLINQGLDNVDIFVNFKDIEPLKENEIVVNLNRPYKLCTFSRVMKEKGIEDAIEAVRLVNEKASETLYTLDIYGQIEAGYKESFDNLLNTLPEYIRYMGCIESSKGIRVLSQYDFLLFPTYYEGEGMAGTLVDSMFAGLPAIVSNWKYNEEVIIDKFNGFVFETRNVNQLKEILQKIEVENIADMKKNCLRHARNFDKLQAIKCLEKELG